jgi:hypothetical protein
MFLLFVRRFNDVDHIVPIAFKLAQAGIPVKLLAQSADMTLSGDFRVDFLAKECGVPIGYLPEQGHQTLTGRVLALLVSALRNVVPDHGFLRRIWWRLCVALERRCETAWADAAVSGLAPRLLVFDWGKTEGTPLGEIVQSAKRRGIAIVAVPHGVNYMTNDLYTLSAVRSGIAHKYGKYLCHCDWVITQHRRHAEWMARGGVPAEKLVVLGSTRYCREWRDKLRDILPSRSLKIDGSNRLRVAYMDHTAELRLNVAVIEESLARIARLDFVELVIKPTTGGVEAYSSRRLRELAGNHEKTNSLSLIEWADVVMGTTSSILLDVLLEGKTLLYPKFYHENDQLFDEMKSCWRVDDQNDLERALRLLHLKRDARPYSETDVDQFISEVVYGGKPGRDILGDYMNFLCSVADGNLYPGR